MNELNKRIEENGLTCEAYEACMRDIRGKMTGDNDMDWADIIGKYNLDMHYDTLRKASQTIFGGDFVSKYLTEKKFAENQKDGYLAMLNIEKRELIKERQKLSDERAEYQRLLREEARRESFIDLVKRAMSVSVEPLEVTKPDDIDSDTDLIVCLSDTHAGMNVNNSFNLYNTNVLRHRLEKYAEEILSVQELHRCRDCYVVLGGDLISGWIHKNLRLQNNENVIEQIKVVSASIGYFVRELANVFPQVHIYSVSGNHSRLSPSKEDQLKGEELDALVPFYLALSFDESTNVVVHDNTVDDTILSFRTRGGKVFYGVHGDKDSPSSVVRNLTLLTGIKPDAIIMAHKHRNGYFTEHGVKTIQTGSVIGADDYSIDHRFGGIPEQCLIVTDDRRAIRCIYDVNLD